MTLITADIGNVNLKYRRGGAWTVEPSLVRTAGPLGYQFVDDTAPRALVYESGPAAIPAQPVYIGRDAEHGQNDLAIVGSAELRVRSAAYILLHLYAMLASLPLGVTTAEVSFAGGLPVVDAASPGVAEALRARLKGTHTLRWGAVTYRVTVTRVLLVPQPIGAVATALFSVDGRIRANGALAHTRFVLDVGGGTTDYTGRVGLELIPGTEGGVRLGMVDAARRARELIQARYPRLRNLSDATVLHLLRSNRADLAYQGDTISIRDELNAGLGQTAAAILADILPRWERVLEQGEVLICGGGGAAMAGSLCHELSAITRVTVLPEPLYAVVDGIERLARHKLTG